MSDSTSGGSDQVSGYIRTFASYVLVNICMVYMYVRPYCSIYDIFATIMTRPPQLYRNETFCKLKGKNAYHQRFDLKIVILQPVNSQHTAYM